MGPRPRRRPGLALALALAAALAGGCTGTTVIRTSPPDATVRVGGIPLPGNSFDYGRFALNEYRIEVSAPGYRSKEVVADVHLGSRAAIVGLFSFLTGLATLGVGFAGAFAIPWNGELESEIFVALEMDKE